MPLPRRRLPTMRLRSVRLDAALLTVEGDAPVWMQIAAEGDYRGHSSGAFVLDAAAFEEIVANFRAHPSYTGTDGVVAFDFNHASEMDPSEGDLAVKGAPAQAWAIELDVRPGAKGLELWSLTQLLEPAKGYIREKKIKWTSVCVWPDARDPVTGERIGWYLSSVAFTNDPFIQGMVPIAASRHFDPYCPPSTPEQVLQALRSVFGLPELATADEVMTALLKLRSYATGGAAPPAGVDVGEMVGELRLIFNLPTLSSPDDVFDQADALLAALYTPGSATTIAATREDPATMNHHEAACIALAARLRCKVPEKPELLGAVLCEAVDAAVEVAGKEANDVTAKLRAVLAAIGVPDPDQAVERITQMSKQVAEYEAAMPELAQLRELKQKAETDAEEEDVSMAMTYYKLPPQSRAPTLAQRKHLGRAKFHEYYPPPTAEQRALATNVSGNGGAGAGTGGTGSARGKVPVLPNGTVPTLALINAQPGGNPNMKAVALVRANGGEKFSNEDVSALAFTIVRTLGGGSAGAPSRI